MLSALPAAVCALTGQGMFEFNSCHELVVRTASKTASTASLCSLAERPNQGSLGAPETRGIASLRGLCIPETCVYAAGRLGNMSYFFLLYCRNAQMANVKLNCQL
jgi:hypothetical protein